MSTTEVVVPELGGADQAEVVEILVAVGAQVGVGTTLIEVESDKAVMEIPAPIAGQVVAIKVAIGDEIRAGTLIALIEAEGVSTIKAEAAVAMATASVAEAPLPTPATLQSIAPSAPSTTVAMPLAKSSESELAAPATEKLIHAGPAVRKLARELGIALEQVQSTGPKNRIVKEDLIGFIKQRLAGAVPTGGALLELTPAAVIDFASFGSVRSEPLSRTQRAAARNLSRSWLTIPHVTHFDEADIGELEKFRRSERERAAKDAAPLTILPFIICALVAALRLHPKFNASLDSTGETLIIKEYYHIGIAVDTEQGLLVPVVRDADRKGLRQLADELRDLSDRARQRRLKPEEMQGATFTITSLGGLGGIGFTPIINAPEVAILGVSRAQIKPHFDGAGFVPATRLPLSLSYDHRVINGADAARFCNQLIANLEDLRRLLL